MPTKNSHGLESPPLFNRVMHWLHHHPVGVTVAVYGIAAVISVAVVLLAVNL